MKKVFAVILASVIALSCFGFLAGCDGSNDIQNITKSDQITNDVKMPNYTVKLKDSVDWASISESDREKIAVTGYNEAQKKVQEDGVFNYNILGVTADGQPAFMFNGEKKTVVIIVDGGIVGEVEVEVPGR